MDFSQLFQVCPDPALLERVFYVERYAWLSLTQDPAMVLSLDGQVEDANTHWERVTGLEREGLQDGYLLEFIHFDDRERVLADMQKLVTSDIGSASAHFRFLCKNDQYKLLNWTFIFSPVHESYFCVAREVRSNERRHTENLAFRDVLTGLSNRLALTGALPTILAEAKDQGFAVALFFIDLDGFKTVNDTLGHKAGDTLLVRAARRMETCVGDLGQTFRLGGDEFIILLPRCGRRGDAENLAANLVAQLSTAYELDGQKMNTGASIGVSVFPGDAQGDDDLLDRADQAMYIAKRTGKSRFVFYADVRGVNE
jgi:diguanylate cyclase (GGDEF)-like protein/PAS domain S-box-containing protein